MRGQNVDRGEHSGLCGARNPQNWSLSKKMFVTFQICMYTTAVYLGSSIYSPATEYVMHRFNVNAQLASMGLSMYVLAYGIGVSYFPFHPIIFAEETNKR